MSQTISEGRLFRVTVAVDDERLKAMRKAPEAAAQAVQAGAMYWHTGILPEHFKPGNGAKYDYAERSPTYLKARNKAGKPLLVFSGSLRKDLSSRAAFKIGGALVVEMKMTARVLNFVPNMQENNPDKYVKHKNGRGYPNLKREIKAITGAEYDAVSEVVTRGLEKSFNPPSSATA